jgi:hypothetical protein
MGDDSEWFAMAALNLVFVVPQCYVGYAGGIILQVMNRIDWYRQSVLTVSCVIKYLLAYTHMYFFTLSEYFLFSK